MYGNTKARHPRNVSRLNDVKDTRLPRQSLKGYVSVSTEDAPPRIYMRDGFVYGERESSRVIS